VYTKGHSPAAATLVAELEYVRFSARRLDPEPKAGKLFVPKKQIAIWGGGRMAVYKSLCQFGHLASILVLSALER